MREAPAVTDVIEKLWPYDGPHHPDRVRDAAAALPLLVRYLNNATGPWRRLSTLPYVSDVDTIVGSLMGAVGGLRQLLEQLGDAVAAHQRAGGLYDDQDPADVDLAAARAGSAVAALVHTRPTVDRLYQALAAVQRHTAGLGNHVTAVDLRGGGGDG